MLLTNGCRTALRCNLQHFITRFLTKFDYGFAFLRTYHYLLGIVFCTTQFLRVWHCHSEVQKQNILFFISDKTIILSRVTRKPTICICENKGADQLRSNCEADQRLCFRHKLLVVFCGLCRTSSQTTNCYFSHEAVHFMSFAE